MWDVGCGFEDEAIAGAGHGRKYRLTAAGSLRQRARHMARRANLKLEREAERARRWMAQVLDP